MVVQSFCIPASACNFEDTTTLMLAASYTADPNDIARLLDAALIRCPENESRDRTLYHDGFYKALS